MKIFAPLLAALLLLSGCSERDVAARVGDVEITTDQVDVLTEADCTLSASAGQASGPQPVRPRRARAVGQLIDLEVLRVAGAEQDDYDTKTYAAELARLRQDLAVLPDGTREQVEDFYADFIKGVLKLREAVLRDLAAQGAPQPDQQVFEQALQARYAEIRADLDIEVNPAYSPDENGLPGASDGSLSVAVSDYAKQAASPQPDSDYLGELAPKLLCG